MNYDKTNYRTVKIKYNRKDNNSQGGIHFGKKPKDYSHGESGGVCTRCGMDRPNVPLSSNGVCANCYNEEK